MFTSSGEDSDELPSLSSLLPRRTAGAREPTPVEVQSETVEDPAEHAIPYSKTRRQRGASKDLTRRKNAISSSSSSQSIASVSQGQIISGKQKVNGSLSSNQITHHDLNSSGSKSSDVAPHFDIRTSNSEKKIQCDCAIPSKDGIQRREHGFDDRIMPSEQVLVTGSQASASGQGALSKSTSRSLAVNNASDVNDLYQVSKPGDKQVPLRPPEQIGRSKAQSTLSIDEKSKLDTRRRRRVTIITISDSEDDTPVIPPKTPTRSRAIVESEDEAFNVVEEVSFADYSDSDGSVVSDGKDRPGTALLQVIDIDSSDSDNDAARGIISWNPTPRRLKNIVKPSSLLPLSPLPAFIGQPDVKTKGPVKDNQAPLVPKSTNVALTPNTVQRPRSQARTAGPTPSRTDSRIFAKKRDQLAMKLLEELNNVVFSGKLPEHLTIVWNGRLNTTAGRANWKKTSNKSTGSVTYHAEIELSVKVIDSEEKLKCTLSHEICHIAAWAIDKEMKPAHGPAFKYWGRKIMAARKDIKVTTKHSYEIAYKYRWQCTRLACGKVYGRHSKSIDPTRHACGLCEGKLVRLDKDGEPVKDSAGTSHETPRKQSEWSSFSKNAFKRLKAQNPSLGMTDINKLVAAEWALTKSARSAKIADNSSLEAHLERLKL